MELSRISGSLPITPGQKTGSTSQAGSAQNLGNTFKTALEGLSAAENNADTLMERLATGEDVEIHEVMIAMEEADVGFRVAIAVRDKLIESYQEIMRIQV
ncbi:MAG: flagellar hook-basal body complex protein FliE [Anaerolineales bacterium]|nr:flagellar hook-basal body complex protein FliE [Anaerolineales bacterium]